MIVPALPAGPDLPASPRPWPSGHRRDDALAVCNGDQAGCPAGMAAGESRSPAPREPARSRCRATRQGHPTSPGHDAVRRPAASIQPHCRPAVSSLWRCRGNRARQQANDLAAYPQQTRAPGRWRARWHSGPPPCPRAQVDRIEDPARLISSVSLRRRGTWAILGARRRGNPPRSALIFRSALLLALGLATASMTTRPSPRP